MKKNHALAMNELIESTYDLRKELADIVDLLRDLDPLPQERARTAGFKAELIRQYGSVCASCGSRGRVEAAHVVPLEIGGPTLIKNLVLLCHTCHEKYDRGGSSIATMQRLVSAWHMGRRPAEIHPETPSRPRRSPTVVQPPCAVEDVLMSTLRFQSERKFVKAVTVVNAALARANLAENDRIYLLIKRAELTRRRAAHGVIDEALKTLKRIDESKVPLPYKAVFYYEYGYVLRLLGHHGDAAKYMHHSAVAASEAEGGSHRPVGYVAAVANEVLCELAEKEDLAKRDARSLEAKLSDLERICSKEGGYWAGRWAMNCAAHKLQVRLKARDATGCWKAIRRTRKMYYELDVNTGWDAGGRQTLSLLEGLVRVLFPGDKNDVKVGIGLLARSFIGRLGPRQRPEGARDVAFGLALGLRRAHPKIYDDHASRIEAIAKRTVDGTSVLWPWKAVNG